MLSLPRRLTIERLDPFLGAVADILAAGVPGPVTIDFDRLEFIDPAGTVTLSNTVDFLRSRGFQPEPKVLVSTKQATTYLSDVRFFDLLADPANTDLEPGRKTTFPLSRVAHAQTFDLLQNRFTPWLGAILSASAASFEQLRACLGELFNNIADHADVPTGFFFAQHFPNIHRVDIALADFGVGIPARVRLRIPDLDDGAALAKAFEEGFSTRTTPRNRGAGLDWLKRYVVDTNGGQVKVCSHHGRLDASPGPYGAIFKPSSASGFFPGVLYYLTLRTDVIEPVEASREELEW
jgi:hypothetical protein